MQCLNALIAVVLVFAESHPAVFEVIVMTADQMQNLNLIPDNIFKFNITLQLCLRTSNSRVVEIKLLE